MRVQMFLIQEGETTTDSVVACWIEFQFVMSVMPIICYELLSVTSY